MIVVKFLGGAKKSFNSDIYMIQIPIYLFNYSLVKNRIAVIGATFKYVGHKPLKNPLGPSFLYT